MDIFINIIKTFWPLFTAIAGIAIPVIASGHAILYKRDSRATVAWVGVIWLVPFLGALLYLLLGINRIRRRVAGQRGHESAHYRLLDEFSCNPEDLTKFLPENRAHLSEMAKLTFGVAKLPLLTGNSIDPLFDGDEAYPAMIDAIDNAKQSVTLLVYIFDNDSIGRRFADALIRAHKRGVRVRVLVDAVGARYSVTPITRQLTEQQVPAAHFMSGLLTWRTPYMNLRNHRKIMIVDGILGFTGGMNIRESHHLSINPLFPTMDINFKVMGPVVQQLQAVFVEDWHFTTGELLEGNDWFPEIQNSTGNAVSRAIPDGPDHIANRMEMTFLGALATARHSVKIMTPYFIPDRALISALNICALRGVKVDIVLPKVNNLKMIAWASMAQMWQILEWGCRVWMSNPPFEHSKIMVVDDTLSLFGSSNWDSRSLRLNFELNMESYDTELAKSLEARIQKRITGAHRLTLDDVNARPLPVKLRDGIMRLAAPFL